MYETQSPAAGLGEEALRRLADATVRHPSDAEAWEGLAHVRVGRAEWAGGLEAAEQALALGPGRERALGLAAAAAVRLRKFDVAEGYAHRAVAANPGNPAAHLQLAEVRLAVERFADAEAELRALLAQCPNHIMARALLAVALHQQGKGTAARAEMERAVRIDPRQAAALWAAFRARTE
jgi:tetratricopeptide (TPR) repeat protein